jgi:hypothetical protein
MGKLLARSRTDPLPFLPAVLIFFFSALGLSAAVRYVDANGVNPTPPYPDWSTAATNIQDAIDTADPGDIVLVTNGVYASGQKVVNGYLTNRLAVTKPLSLESVNGPQVTMIEGLSNSLRCVYLTNGASLSGFSLSKGDATLESGSSGGGIWCESSAALISNCVITTSRAVSGGGVFRGTLNNCVLSNNWANDGGGAFWAALNNCTAINNSAYRFGGGAAYSTLSDCVIVGNSATNRETTASGGGTYQANLNRCSLSNNFASAAGGGSAFGTRANCNVAGVVGGGAYDGILISCQLIGNSAPRGGGAALATLGLCSLSSNYAAYEVGGAFNCTLSGSQLTGNSVDLGHGSTFGGGASLGTLTDCILSGNSAYWGGGADYATLNNCTLTNNWATEGGAAHEAFLNACLMKDNAAGSGGGVSESTLANCILTGNSGGYGGAAIGATLLGCTVVSNSSPFGGGVYGGTSENCIIYFNGAENFYDEDVLPWYSATTLNYCCTTPLPATGIENITVAPLFTDLAGGNFRLKATHHVSTPDKTPVPAAARISMETRAFPVVPSISAHMNFRSSLNNFLRLAPAIRPANVWCVRFC